MEIGREIGDVVTELRAGQKVDMIMVAKVNSILVLVKEMVALKVETDVLEKVGMMALGLAWTGVVVVGVTVGIWAAVWVATECKLGLVKEAGAHMGVAKVAKVKFSDGSVVV